MTETTDTPRYSTMGLADAEAFYHDEIAPQMRAEGLAPEHETPTYSWLESHFPGFIKHLSRRFDLSPGDFYDEIGVPIKPESDAGPFDFVDDDETRAALEDYLVELRDRQGRAESTVATRRSALRLYVRTYKDVNGTDDLLGPLHDDAARADEMDRVADTFDVLRRREDTLTTHASRRKYVQEVRQFYTHQVTFKGARHNPTDQLERRFGWDSTPEWDNQALEADQIRTLYRTADNPVDRLIVIGVCGWGLRPSEVASLHVNQLVLDPPEDDPEAGPYIEFGSERKNGPGTVALLTGLEDVDAQIDAVVEEADDDWMGYVFPSPSAESGHLSTSTIRRRFKDLAERAGVTVDRGVPTPKMGRRYWYTAYGEAVRRVAERFADVAAEQGSKSAEVVLDNYLSEAEKRRHRREEMREDLEGLFAEDAVG
jgi:integrase